MAGLKPAEPVEGVRREGTHLRLHAALRRPPPGLDLRLRRGQTPSWGAHHREGRAKLGANVLPPTFREEAPRTCTHPRTLNAKACSTGEVWQDGALVRGSGDPARRGTDRERDRSRGQRGRAPAPAGRGERAGGEGGGVQLCSKEAAEIGRGGAGDGRNREGWGGGQPIPGSKQAARRQGRQGCCRTD